MDNDKYKLDDFKLYKLARQFRRNVYKLVKQLPAEERYCLDPQMRKAIVSVTNNIALDMDAGTSRKICVFVVLLWKASERIARWGSTNELRLALYASEEILDDINVCLDEGYGELAYNEQLKREGYALIAKINGYIGYLRQLKQESE